MKLASFFLLSVAFHAALLTVPLSFFETGGEQMIPVTLLGVGGGGEQGLGGKGLPGEKSKHGPRTTMQNDRAELENKNVGGGLKTPAEASFPAPFFSAADADKETVIAGSAVSGGGGEGGISYGVGDGGDGEGRFGGMGNSGIGVGLGRGGGDGGSGGWKVVQASYAYNPRPEYPEIARKEGWEGTVLLRVLVDQEGKSKWIEVSRSSGFDTLDQAAMKTVKGWRFHPARYGERMVESWVRIPIVFRLSDLKN